MPTGRRNFLFRALGGIAALTAADADALHAAGSQPGEPWLAAIASKKYKAFMDVSQYFTDGTPFRRARNLLGVMHSSYGASDGDVGVAVGMHARGLAHLVGVQVWTDLGLAEWLLPQLNSAESAVLKAAQGGAGGLEAMVANNRELVQELHARGVRILACRETMARLAQRKAKQSGESAGAVVERIVQGLHEGVEPVPAMIAAAVVAQDRGARYVALA